MHLVARDTAGSDVYDSTDARCGAFQDGSFLQERRRADETRVSRCSVSRKTYVDFALAGQTERLQGAA
jgi:hypothetical protein